MYYAAQTRKVGCSKCCFMDQAVGSAILFPPETESFTSISILTMTAFELTCSIAVWKIIIQHSIFKRTHIIWTLKHHTAILSDSEHLFDWSPLSVPQGGDRMYSLPFEYDVQIISRTIMKCEEIYAINTGTNFNTAQNVPILVRHKIWSEFEYSVPHQLNGQQILSAVEWIKILILFCCEWCGLI